MWEVFVGQGPFSRSSTFAVAIKTLKTSLEQSINLFRGHI